MSCCAAWGAGSPTFRGIDNVPPDRTAFAARDADYVLTLAANAADPGEDRALHISSARRTRAGLRPWACGTYVSHRADVGCDRVHEAYRPPTWPRLTRLKARGYPDNVFTLN